MKPTKFVNLHSHTSFSINDGMDYPQEHIDFIIENGGTAWAMTDHGNLDGFAHAWLHVQKLNKAGANFKFIPGCEMYIHPDLNLWQIQYDLKKATNAADSAEMIRLQSLLDTMKKPKSAFSDINNEDIEIDDNEVELDFEDENATKSSKFYDPLKRRHHMVVLPRNSKGLESLFSLISKGYDKGFYRFPRVDFRQIKEVNQDNCLIALSACIGGLLSYQIFQHFQTLEFDDLKPSLLDDSNIMEKVINSVRDGYHDMIDAFGEDYTFLELQFNKLNAQHLANRALIEFARREGLVDKLVVTCDSHYSRPEKWLAREMYKALGWYDKAGFSADSLPKSKEDLKCELYPKNQDQVWDSYLQYTEDYDFYDDSEICNAIENTHYIAYDLIGDISIDTKMKLPSYTIPEGKTANQALIDLVKEGLIKKGLDKNPDYINAAKYELKVIIDKQFAEYFVTTKAIMDLAYDHMPTGAGRGSGAGSLVNYVLNITKLDPLKYGLFFSRFMDPTRSDYPDIDNDVADRDALIKLMKTKWGNENILPISNFNRFKLKSLVKDIWKFYGLDFKVINNVLVKLDQEVLQGLRNDNKEPNGPLELNFEDCMEYSSSFRKLMLENPEVAEHIDNLFKQNKTIGKHAGGVIVSENILDRMPVRKVRGDLQTPWVEGASYKHLEDFGWIKFDILGVAALDNIRRAIELVLKKQGIKKPTWLQCRDWWEKNLDPDVIDFEDSKVFDVYRQSKWGGIFQCVTGDTKVTMADGTIKNIIDVKQGDEVISFNEETKQFETKPVIGFYDQGVKEVFEFELDNGETIKCTGDHKFLTSNRGWVEAQHLTEDDDIVNLK